MERDARRAEIERRAGAAERVLRRRAARMGDGAVAAAPSRERIRTAGFTIIELIVTMALFGVMLAIAMPHAQRSSITLWNANEQLLSDLRRARADALTRGDHFVLEVTGASSYRERRMQLVGNAWLPIDPAVRTRNLPSGVSFTAGVGESFEFNTRGLLVIPDAAGTVQMQDSHTHHSRTVTVWPSGQVVAS